MSVCLCQGQKNIFSKNAQNLIKHGFGGVLRLDLGRGRSGSGVKGQRSKKHFPENTQNFMKHRLGGVRSELKNNSFLLF